MKIVKAIRRNVLSATATLLAASSAFAAPLDPGDTLTPVPTLARGGTEIYRATVGSTSRCSPRMQVRVLRQTDDTLAFEYILTMPSALCTNTSGGFSVTGFDGFTTDVSQSYRGVPPANLESAVAAIRSSGEGTSIFFDYIYGFTNNTLNPGDFTANVYILTDATSFTTDGRLYVVPTTFGRTLPLSTRMPRPVTDSTPPNVSISLPAPFGNACDPQQVRGTANDPQGFDFYTLEWSANPGGPWTLINESESAVTNNVLGNWDTPPSAGWYYLRLTATNSEGLTETITQPAYVDQAFDGLAFTGPGDGQVLGRSICIGGSIFDYGSGIDQYTVDYAPLPAGAPFLPVNSAQPTYNAQIINGTFAVWNSASGGAAVPDGNYRIRVAARDLCGHTALQTHDIVVDNTAPTAVIANPSNCSNVLGSVTIRGTVADAHLSGWSLQYSGGDSHGWTTIASGTSNVINGVLGVWNTAGLRPCDYALRLVASDSSALDCNGAIVHSSEYITTVRVGCPADVDDGSGNGNADGGVTIDDLLYFLERYQGGC